MTFYFSEGYLAYKLTTNIDIFILLVNRVLKFTSSVQFFKEYNKSLESLMSISAASIV